MTLVIVTILLLGYFLIATEKYTNVNKAAVAIFVGTLGWILYICYGTDFVMSQHANEYLTFLNGNEPTSALVKQFIAQNVFLEICRQGIRDSVVSSCYNDYCGDSTEQWLS